MENSRTAYGLKESSPVVLVHPPVNSRPVSSYYYFLLNITPYGCQTRPIFLVPVVGNAEEVHSRVPKL